MPPVAIALVHAGLGDGEAVMEWLAKAYDARDVHLIYLPVDPKWDPYRADPDSRLFSHVVASQPRRKEVHSRRRCHRRRTEPKRLSVVR